MKTSDHFDIHGYVRPGFEPVRDAFAANFARRHELGGTCCVFHRGEKVVDLWGGIRNKQTGEPWQKDTMVLVYSATKGLAAMTLAIAHSRGWLDYEQPVCKYWQEFAASSFGSPGAGGSLGFADPEAGVGYACVTCRMETSLLGDPRDVALRDALYTALAALPRVEQVA